MVIKTNIFISHHIPEWQNRKFAVLGFSGCLAHANSMIAMQAVYSSSQYSASYWSVGQNRGKVVKAVMGHFNCSPIGYVDPLQGHNPYFSR